MTFAEVFPSSSKHERRAPACLIQLCRREEAARVNKEIPFSPSYLIQGGGVKRSTKEEQTAAVLPRQGEEKRRLEGMNEGLRVSRCRLYFFLTRK